jgi:alpha-tubulin suppressor-like RCC1 family protein
MKNRGMHLLALFSVVLVFSLIFPASAGGASATMTLPEDCSIVHPIFDTSSSTPTMALSTPAGNITPMVAAGYYHTVGLKSDGTVVAVGNNEYGQCNVGGWANITQVAAGHYHTVGLKSDGTVVAAGDNSYGQCNVGGWANITQVAAGYYHTVGLKSDGTVVAIGDNEHEQCNVGSWTDIVQVTAGGGHTVALKSWGTVVTVGDNSYGQGNVGDWRDITQVAAGRYHTVGLKFDGTVVATATDVSGWRDITQVAAGHGHTVGLKSDGTVVAVGVANDYGQCDVGGWRDIVQVAAGGYHTVGVEANGSAVAVGRNSDHKQCEISGWTDITQVTAGWQHTVGLEDDGIVVAVGYNYYGQCNVSNWTDITQVAAGWYHTVGLEDDGTVVAVGENLWGQCNVGNWTDITQVAAGDYHTVGLKSDGTVIAIGDNTYGQCNVGGWTDIIQVAAGHYHTVGLKSDGTVVATAYNVGYWTDIIQVAAGGAHTVGLESDGTVVAAGDNSYGQRDVGGWTDITQIAAGEYHTVGLKSDGTVVTAGPGTLFAAWNLALALPPPQRALTISSTRGGSVSNPGTGTFDYDRWTVVALSAEPEEGYHFVNWTGDVNTIGNVTAAATNITMDGDYSITANFVSVEPGDAGIVAGDWIKLAYNVTGVPAGQPYVEWVKFEFLSVNGTTADVRRTGHMSDGTEQSSSGSIDVVSGSEVPWLAGIAIPANWTTGDSVYIVGYGNLAIEGEAIRTYAGENRTVVYAGFSQDETRVTYYWDKLTGVLVELSSTSPGISGTAKATETNMWGAAVVGMPWWPWIIVGVAAVGVAVFFMRRRGRGPAATQEETVD